MFRKTAIRFMLLALICLIPVEGNAEYGDVIINNYADDSSVRPVIFPHWFHRIRFTCKACHAGLGIKFKAGGNKIKMADIMNGQYCGACHNGQIAWDIENCDFCHSGKPGTSTKVHHSTQQKLIDVKRSKKSNKKDKTKDENKGASK